MGRFTFQRGPFPEIVKDLGYFRAYFNQIFPGNVFLRLAVNTKCGDGYLLDFLYKGWIFD